MDEDTRSLMHTLVEGSQEDPPDAEPYRAAAARIARALEGVSKAVIDAGKLEHLKPGTYGGGELLALKKELIPAVSSGIQSALESALHDLQSAAREKAEREQETAEKAASPGGDLTIYRSTDEGGYNNEVTYKVRVFLATKDPAVKAAWDEFDAPAVLKKLAEKAGLKNPRIGKPSEKGTPLIYDSSTKYEDDPMSYGGRRVVSDPTPDFDKDVMAALKKWAAPRKVRIKEERIPWGW